MNLGRRPSVSPRSGSAAVFGLLLSGCLGVPDLAGTHDPLVVSEAELATDSTRARATMVAEMQAEAVAAASLPDAGGQRLARPEPRSAIEVAAIEAELELIARRRASSANAREIAALEARARQLQRLAAAAQAGTLRR